MATIERNNQYRRYKLSEKGVEARTRRYFKKHYGITLEQFHEMSDAQNGVCAICFRASSRKTDTRLVVDHCHATGKVRGLLCHSCNVALGAVQDNEERLLSLVAYLKRSRNGND